MMKRMIAMLLCLLMLGAMLSGCSGDAATAQTEQTAAATPASEIEPEQTEYAGIGYHGLYIPANSPEEIVQAEGRDADVTVTGDDGTTTMIYNGGDCFGLVFDQVQYSLYSDHTQVTCCYTLPEGEVMDEVLTSMREAVSEEYGEPAQTTTSSGLEMLSWSDGTSRNRIRLYALNESAVRLQFTLSN